jgi:hypothetical protein
VSKSILKVFRYRELEAAILWARKGHQALHLMQHSEYRWAGPPCFKRSKVMAHFFDQDVGRLIKSAKRLGVRVIKVEREGDEGQHIDLCGKPLEKALSEAS